MDDKDERIKAEILENNKMEIKDENIKETANENLNEQKTEEIKNEKIPNTKEKVTYQFKQIKNKKSNNKTKIAIICVFIILLIIAIFSTCFAIFNSKNVSILKGISIRNIKVEGLTQEEAIKLLNEKFEYEKSNEIKININGEVYSLIPEQIEVEYNIEKAINEAYNIGRDGNILQNNFAILNTFFEKNNIELEVLYNDEILENYILDLNAKISGAMINNTYCIEDDELIITRGKSGIQIDLAQAKEKIIKHIKEGNTEELVLDTIYQECPEIDIEKIHSEVYSEPQNATYKKDPFEIIAHKNGVDFDVESAKEIVKEQADEYVIKLKFKEPEILTNEIGEEAFPDLLGSYTTKFDETNIPRSKNVKQALKKLNGVVVMPGETFSYNKTLGKRTVEAGYDYAAGYAGGKVVPMLGGGICQVSSTLYDAVVYANLEIVERYNHMFQTQYIGAGRDATVVYGSLDFKFKNTREYPIMIKTKSNGGVAEVRIFGIKQDVEYEIEIVPTVLNYTSYKVVYEEDASLKPGEEKVEQSGMRGCKTITYKITKLNGQEILKEVLSTDTYDPMNKIIKKGKSTVQTDTTPEQPEVEQPELEQPTEEPKEETNNTVVENPTDTNTTIENSTNTTENNTVTDTENTVNTNTNTTVENTANTIENNTSVNSTEENVI